MMALLIPFAVLLFLSWLFPKGTKYFIVGPLVGTAGGGLAWAIAAMIFSSLITLNAFIVFMVVGIVVAEVIMSQIS